MRIGHATHRGMVRELNEDGYLVLTRPALAPELTALLAVADGMGGHQAGDVASTEVIRSLDELFSSSIYQQKVGYSLQRDDYYIVVLKEVLEQINDRICHIASTRSDLSGMGSTASLCLLVNQHLYVGHVGDSRIYRLRGGEFQRLTQDHTWVAEQVAAGLMTPEQAAVDPKRSRITRCLGYGPALRVDRAVHDLQPGDLLLLCSDGLTATITDGEIAQFLASAPTPQAACDRFIETANQRGGPDNTTVIVAQVAAGEGSDLSGGRAIGPRGREELQPQADTVKIVRPKPAATAVTPAVRRGRPPRQAKAPPHLPRPLVVAVLAVLFALACTAADLVLILVSHQSPGEQMLQLLAVFVAAVVGVAAGLGLSLLLHEGTRHSPTQTKPGA